MRAGDGHPLGRRPIEHPSRRVRARSFRRDIEHQRRVRPRHLHRGEMHDVAPDQQSLAARMDQPVGVARRVAGPQRRGDAGQHLAVLDAADAIAVGRGHGALRLGVARDALGIVGLAACGRARTPPRPRARSISAFGNTALPASSTRPSEWSGCRCVSRIDVDRRPAATPMARRFCGSLPSVGSMVWPEPASLRISLPRWRIRKAVHVERQRLAVRHAGQPLAARPCRCRG